MVIRLVNRSIWIESTMAILYDAADWADILSLPLSQLQIVASRRSVTKMMCWEEAFIQLVL